MQTALRVFAGLLAGVVVTLSSIALGDATQFDTAPVSLLSELVGAAFWCGAPLWGLLAGVIVYRVLARTRPGGD